MGILRRIGEAQDPGQRFYTNAIALSLLIKITAAAPSLRVDAFAAVTVLLLRTPALAKGFCSKFTLYDSHSSLNMVTSPFLPVTLRE